jgi:hypothetical protein
MNMNKNMAVQLIGTIAALAVCGCVSATGNIYDVCSGTEQCPDGTSCQPASATTDGFTGSFCTLPCTTCSDCPSDGFAAPVCFNGQCYAGCPGNTGCPYSETCATCGATLFCVP